MNDIVKPLTPDGMCGWDAHGQLWLWEPDGEGRRGTIIGDPRGHKCRICLQGWTLTVESMKDQRWSAEYEEWSHLSCFVRYVSLVERDMWFDVLVDAGLRFDGLEEIPNKYWCGDPYWSKRPWYRVKLLDSDRRLKLGRRKRVYYMEIEPGESPFSADLGRELFKGEEVTKEIGKDRMHVHAWGHDKARQYMKAFAKALGLEKRAAAGAET